MTHMKMLGLLAVAAAALMAFVGTASATALAFSSADSFIDTTASVSSTVESGLVLALLTLTAITVAGTRQLLRRTTTTSSSSPSDDVTVANDHRGISKSSRQHKLRLA